MSPRGHDWGLGSPHMVRIEGQPLDIGSTSVTARCRRRRSGTGKRKNRHHVDMGTHTLLLLVLRSAKRAEQMGDSRSLCLSSYRGWGAPGNIGQGKPPCMHVLASPLSALDVAPYRLHSTGERQVLSRRHQNILPCHRRWYGEQLPSQVQYSTGSRTGLDWTTRLEILRLPTGQHQSG
jgi:hypothetical protein